MPLAYSADQTVNRERHREADGTMNPTQLDARLNRMSAATCDPLAAALATLPPIGLAEMDAYAALRDRRDTKFALTPAQAEQALLALAGDYAVLEIDGRRQNLYQTLYFDTPALDLFRAHHAGRRQVYKVRSRCYVESELAFMEVKVKRTADETSKHRRPTPALLTELDAETYAWLADYLPPAGPLAPALWNTYTRLTLVSRHGPERVTLDRALRFTRLDGAAAALPGVVLAEVKQAPSGQASPFSQLMRRGGVRPSGFSKYCVGVSLLYPQVKHNNFTPKLRRLASLARGGQHGPH
jgi:hypothetical protein